jgi:hypothetical protein
LAQAIFEPDLLQYKDPNNLHPGYSSYLPTYEDGTECSETLAYRLHKLVKNPEESIQHISIYLYRLQGVTYNQYSIYKNSNY